MYNLNSQRDVEPN